MDSCLKGHAVLSLVAIIGLVISIIVLACSRRLPKFPDKLINFRWPQQLRYGTAPDGLMTQFPPSRRKAISDHYTKSLVAFRREVSQKEVQAQQLSSYLDNNAVQTGRYTPTGISMAEILTLGKFPNYSVLSGVPHPTPWRDFEISKVAFRPFRPFRYTYHQTMSFQKLEPDYWIELEQNYFSSLKQRKDLLEQHGTNILNYDTGSEIACRELMEMVLQYVCTRYPHYFALESSDTIFVNHLLKTRTFLSLQHPLRTLFNNIPEDFAIMQRNEADGMYYLKAGFICSSIGWNFGTHFKNPLSSIHAEVNDYAEKLSKSMDRFFSKMPTEQPIQRGTWFVEDWKPLFVTPEEYSANAGTRHQGERVSIDQCFLRVDWQTLRRLPLSGAIVFNFKAVFTPLTELRDEAYIPSLLYKQITAGKQNLTEGKVHKHIRNVVLDSLLQWKKEQIDKGMIPADWIEGTLAESPFYPGWEKHWRAKSSTLTAYP